MNEILSEQLRNNDGKDRDNRLVTLILAFFVFIAGFACYSTVTKHILPYLDSRNWVAVAAEIRESYVKEDYDVKQPRYSAYIKYRYLFNGQAFDSSKKTFSECSSTSRSTHLKTVKESPVGKQITVYVNPKNPSQAVISRELNSGIFLWPIPFVFFFVISFLFVLRIAQYLGGGAKNGQNKVC